MTSPTGQKSKENLTCLTCGHDAVRHHGHRLTGTRVLRSWIVCKHCTEVQNKKAAAHLAAEKAKWIVKQKERAGIEGRLQDRSLNGFEAKTSEQKAAIEIADIFARDGGPAWLAFCGATGTGKSHLAVAIVNYVIESYSRSVCYVKVIEMMRRFRATYHHGPGETEQDVANHYKKIRFLILDEFGIRKELSEWERMTLDDILDHRCEQQRRTLIVSNMTAKDMFAAAGERIESRFADCGQIVNFTWGDYRKRKAN